MPSARRQLLIHSPGFISRIPEVRLFLPPGFDTPDLACTITLSPIYIVKYLLPVDNDVAADHGIASYSHLSGKGSFSPPLHRNDVYLAINLGAGADNGIPGNSFVDGATGADLYIILNDHPPAGTPVLVSFLGAFEVKRIGADTEPDWITTILANDDMLGDRHIVMYVKSVSANFDMVPMTTLGSMMALMNLTPYR